MEPNSPRARPVIVLATILAAIFIALHGVSIAAPTGGNWGFHFLAYFPLPVGIVCLALMGLMLIPFFQEQVIRTLEWLESRWGSQSPSVKRSGVAAGILVAILLFWYLRERTLLLGDGGLVVRSLEESETPGALSVVFRTAPLSGLAAWVIARITTLFGLAQPAEAAWRVLSILAGAGGLIFSARIARELVEDPSARVLFFLFIATTGTTQLYFGYVETYPLAYLLTLAFLALSLSWYRTGKKIVLVMLLFVLMVLSHITLALFLPGLLLLLWKGREEGRRRLVPGLVIASIAAICLLWVTGFTLAQLAALGDLPGVTRLPLFSAIAGAPYTVVSIQHLADLLNLVILVAPFAPPALLLLWQSGVSIRRDVILQSLLLFAAAGGLWLTITHFTIGLSRDWDVAALSSVGWVVLGAALWARLGSSSRAGMRILAGVTVIAGIHTAAWIATNANQERSLRRFEHLYTDRLWTPHAGTYAFEDLSAFSRTRRDFFPAMVYSAKALALDSTNPRRWLHFAGAAQMAGWDERAMQAYERGLAGSVAEPGHFRDCARLYARNNRLADAIRVLDVARSRFPQDAATERAREELSRESGPVSQEDRHSGPPGARVPGH